MSEYWKSTPKYWCKFCSTYVKDTKFEKAQHEATGKHQGSVQRSLRNLHKEHDKEEREKQRAKDEVARLNGVVSGKAVTSSAWKPSSTSAANAGVKQATVDDRKKQMVQLAEMGVAVPEAFRKEVAMAGDWQTVTSRVVSQEEVKPDALSFGVRKRKLDDEEEEEAAQNLTASRKRWGTAIRQYPGRQAETDDIEALLGAGLESKPDDEQLDMPIVKKEESDVDVHSDASKKDVQEGVAFKLEDKEETTKEGALDSVPVVFKKRKAKTSR